MQLTDSLLTTILAELGCTETLSKEFLRQALYNVALFDAKQKDYGPHNIGGFGTFGVVVRMNDKFERIKNLYKTNQTPVNETTEDTFRDISNYATIAILLDNKIWPK